MSAPAKSDTDDTTEDKDSNSKTTHRLEKAYESFESFRSFIGVAGGIFAFVFTPASLWGAILIGYGAELGSKLGTLAGSMIGDAFSSEVSRDNRKDPSSSVIMGAFIGTLAGGYFAYTGSRDLIVKKPADDFKAASTKVSAPEKKLPANTYVIGPKR